MASGNNWYVFTGAPSSGKTTTLNVLAQRGYKVVPEMARVFIDQEIEKGRSLSDIQPDSDRFEEIVLDMKVKKEAELNAAETILLDRGMHDTLAYYYLYGWSIPQKILDACKKAVYKRVFLFEMLDYEQDYARVESHDTAKKLDKLFRKVYKDYGYDIVIVPKLSVEERAKLIEEHLH